MKRIIAILLVIIVLIGGWLVIKTFNEGGTEPSDIPDGQETSDAVSEDETPEPEEVIPEEEVILQNMTLEQKIGQLFIVRPESVNGGTGIGTYMTDEMKASLKEKMPGGVIMFSENIQDPDQITSFNENLKAASLEYFDLPMFISTDEEGGLVARIGNNQNFDVTRYNNMLEIGETGDPSKAEEVGHTIGEYLSRYGFDLDFAPVSDCFTNPNNQVIGSRAFGSDPDQVSDMVGACIDGFHDEGIMTVIKHYPGHGDTDSDTHTGTVMTNRSWEELKERELIPFIGNLDKTDMIMASHIVSKGVTDDDMPAVMSEVMINEKLRDELGYDGVVITDSMEMGAISNVYTSDEAAVRAIEAGCDIILCPMDFDTAYNGIMDAVRSGRLPEGRIDESVLRIIKLKLKYDNEEER